jgi:hypothetical protein
VKVIESGDYSFLSYSTMDAYGLIYRNTFNPLNPLENFLWADDDGGSDLQFRLNILLSGGMTYVLVMTTYKLNETSAFWIIVQGPKKVILKHLSKYRVAQKLRNRKKIEYLHYSSNKRAGFFVDDRGLFKHYVDKDKHMETLSSVLSLISTKEILLFHR